MQTSRGASVAVASHGDISLIFFPKLEPYLHSQLLFSNLPPSHTSHVHLILQKTTSSQYHFLNPNMSRPRKTRFWHLSMSRLRLRRESSPAQSVSDVYHSMPSTPADSGVGMLDDQKDGFYRYSESLVDEDTRSVASSLIMRPSASMHGTLCDEPVVSTNSHTPPGNSVPRDATWR